MSIDLIGQLLHEVRRAHTDEEFRRQLVDAALRRVEACAATMDTYARHDIRIVAKAKDGTYIATLLVGDWKGNDRALLKIPGSDEDYWILMYADKP